MKNLFKKFHKVLTVVMCLALVLETINLTSISVFAADNEGVVTASGNDITEGDVTGNTPAIEDVSGNDVSGNVPAVEDVSGNDVSGNAPTVEDVSGNDVSGNAPTVEDVSGNDVSGNDVSGNDASNVSEETQKAEDDLAALAQEAVAAIQKKLDSANGFDSKAAAQLGRAETYYNRVVAAPGLSYELCTTLSNVGKNADAAQGSADRAKAEYEAAQTILTKYTEKVDEALTKAQAKDADVTGNAAKAVLAQAQANVDAAKAAYESAQADADAAKELVAQAQVAFDSKEVVAKYYVLNRGLEQPEEVQKHPQENYSAAVIGKLYSGVETGGVRDNSYLEAYYNGVLSDFDTYIMEAPTAEDFGIELAENEEIVWYVIKTESGSIHVNGIITVVESGDNTTTGGDDNNNTGDNNTGDNNTGDNSNTGDNNTGDNTNTGDNNTPANNNPVNNTPANNTPVNNTPVQQPQENDVETEENVVAAPAEVEEVEEVVEEPVTETEETGIAEDASVDEVVEIEDEDVALSSGADLTDDGVVVEIEDEEVPLAAHSSCSVHWIILIVTLLYTVFELIRGISRGKRISELKEETENEMA